MQIQRPAFMPLLQRAAIGALVFFLLLVAGVRSAQAVEIIPAVGISQMQGGEDNKMFLSLGLRTGLVPRVETEFQVGHRSEDGPGGLYDIRTIPVTLSLWLSPVPMLYAGGGGGAYFQAISFDNALLIPNESETKWGAHVGGGVRFPLAPMARLDLNGRYVFLGKQTSALAAGEFDPSFWSASLGLAIGF